jgi:hypothetical protein
MSEESKKIKKSEQEAVESELSEKDLDSVAGGGGGPATGGRSPVGGPPVVGPPVVGPPVKHKAPPPVGGGPAV